jgi:hypothetical protein
MNDLPNFDPIAVADEIAALETEAQDKLAEAEDEFKSRSEKIAAILWDVKQHHPEHLDAICERAKIGRRRAYLVGGNTRGHLLGSRSQGPTHKSHLFR